MNDQQRTPGPALQAPATPTSVPTPEMSPAPAQTRDYAYYRRVFAGQPMPFAFVDLDLLDTNARDILRRAGDKRVRVASKSVRSVAILRRILASDSQFAGLMCYTAREAAYLAAQGFTDLLIGYPAWHEDDLAAVARATGTTGSHITLMADSLAHVERYEAAARRAGLRLPVCLEMDMSIDVPGLHFGVWRSPIRTIDQARAVVERILASPHLTLDGIMGYEAQVAGLGDNYPGLSAKLKNVLVRALQRRSVAEVAARRAALVALIQSSGATPTHRVVNGGGTGSLHTTRHEPAVTEITAGSGFYAPALFDNYRAFRHLPAAGFAVEIVRRPRPDTYTCLGGGYIASGAAGPDRLPKPYLPAGARLYPLEGAGEVQTPIRYTGPERLDLGDPIFLRHSKAGELCERFRTLLLVSNGAIIDEVPTYRGADQCFL